MRAVKRHLAGTEATWKLLANQTKVERTIFPGGDLIGFDSWQGYPRERRELLTHIRDERIRDVVFVTGDIHTFIAGDVRVEDDDERPVATEFVGGSISSQGLGEGGGGLLPGADPRNPNTPQSIIDLLKDANPWVKNAFDHRGVHLPRRPRAAEPAVVAAWICSRPRTPSRTSHRRSSPTTSSRQTWR